MAFTILGKIERPSIWFNSYHDCRPIVTPIVADYSCLYHSDCRKIKALVFKSRSHQQSDCLILRWGFNPRRSSPVEEEAIDNLKLGSKTLSTVIDCQMAHRDTRDFRYQQSRALDSRRHYDVSYIRGGTVPLLFTWRCCNLTIIISRPLYTNLYKYLSAIIGSRISISNIESTVISIIVT